MSSTAIRLSTPLTLDAIQSLIVGDFVLLSGDVYTARDAAHKRFVQAIKIGEKLPMALNGQVIYYVGPAPARPGNVIGPAGPTTAGRMDLYTPCLLELGLKGMIGKGSRGLTVRQALVKHQAVYFVTVGGAAALLAERIKRADLIAFPDLGTEAVMRLEVEDFPLVVANDVHGGDLFESGKEKYQNMDGTRLYESN